MRRARRGKPNHKVPFSAKLQSKPLKNQKTAMDYTDKHGLDTII